MNTYHLPSALLEAIALSLILRITLQGDLQHPHLQTQKLRLNEIKCLIRRLIAMKWQRPHSNPGLTPRSYVIPTKSCHLQRGWVSSVELTLLFNSMLQPIGPQYNTIAIFVTFYFQLVNFKVMSPTENTSLHNLYFILFCFMRANCANFFPTLHAVMSHWQLEMGHGEYLYHEN